MPGTTQIRKSLGALRMVVGAATLISPAISGRAFGLGRIGDDVSTALVARLFGVRDLAIGAATLFAPDESRLRQALLLGMVCDGTDVGSTVIGRRNGVGPLAILAVGGGAATFFGMGLASLVGIDQPAPTPPA